MNGLFSNIYDTVARTAMHAAMNKLLQTITTI